MLPGRWLRTEDYGRMQYGLLFLASRIRDLIIRGGENVYPTEVESCLELADDVLEAAVFGRDDDEFGQVVVGDGGGAGGLPRHRRASSTSTAQAALAYYKVPVEIEVRQTPLPRNAAARSSSTCSNAAARTSARSTRAELRARSVLQLA